MKNLNGKQNLGPEKGIYSYLVKFYHTINTIYMECTAFLKNYFVYLSCAFVTYAATLSNKSHWDSPIW